MSQSTWLARPEDEPQGPPPPSGCALTVLRDGDVIVWLIGDVDVMVALDLHSIAAQAPGIGRRLIIDGSRVTSCDSTVLRFITIASTTLPVTIRRPSPIFADILTFSGLARFVSVPSEPRASR